MSVDPKVYALSADYLSNAGWHNTIDIAHLAARLQDTIDDYMTELDQEVKETSC